MLNLIFLLSSRMPNIPPIPSFLWEPPNLIGYAPLWFWNGLEVHTYPCPNTWAWSSNVSYDESRRFSTHTMWSYLFYVVSYTFVILYPHGAIIVEWGVIMCHIRILTDFFNRIQTKGWLIWNIQIQGPVVKKNPYKNGCEREMTQVYKNCVFTPWPYSFTYANHDGLFYITSNTKLIYEVDLQILLRFYFKFTQSLKYHWQHIQIYIIYIFIS